MIYSIDARASSLVFKKIVEIFFFVFFSKVILLFDSKK